MATLPCICMQYIPMNMLAKLYRLYSVCIKLIIRLCTGINSLDITDTWVGEPGPGTARGARMSTLQFFFTHRSLSVRAIVIDIPHSWQFWLILCWCKVDHQRWSSTLEYCWWNVDFEGCSLLIILWSSFCDFVISCFTYVFNICLAHNPTFLKYINSKLYPYGAFIYCYFALTSDKILQKKRYSKLCM